MNTKLDPELDHGNVEYKLNLNHVEDDSDRLHELASQMRFRLYEGRSEAYYYIGVADDGTPSGISNEELEQSIDTLHKVASIAGAKVTVLRTSPGENGMIAECYVVKQKNPKEIPPDLRVAMVGNVDAGKSTMVGVLENGELDDGRGAARNRVVRYIHELESGRTSSINTTVIGFDIDGKIINHDKVKTPSDFELLENAIKTISFVDLAGHEKYLKTTIKGLTGQDPNYAMLVVSANQGVLQMTKEHLGLLVALKIPFFIIVTKIDMTPDNVRKNSIGDLKKLLKIPGVSRVPMVIKDLDDVVVSVKNIANRSLVPIFKVSTVSGVGLDLLKKFLQLLPITNNINGNGKSFRAYIDDLFSVTGVGTVVSAMVYSGKVKTNELVYVGPFENGEFRKLRIKSIHYKRVITPEVEAGMHATFALHGIKKSELRKGMVLLDSGSSGATKHFIAEIYVLYHSTTIKKGYSPVIHCKSISQSAKIVSIDKERLRTGDRAIVEFEFLYRPEHLRVGQRVIFREGRTKGIGIITKVNN
ncbi:MAG: elongation factor 1-alpha [Candidatus Heimdallarchaeota archaeon]|nr:elongation factor 1-alpha [Candidatus Heimdallarchaeota archaeon]